MTAESTTQRERAGFGPELPVQQEVLTACCDGADQPLLWSAVWLLTFDLWEESQLEVREHQQNRVLQEIFIKLSEEITEIKRLNKPQGRKEGRKGGWWKKNKRKEEIKKIRERWKKDSTTRQEGKREGRMGRRNKDGGIKRTKEGKLKNEEKTDENRIG